jgi:tetratricopeptide (TPR) repeat protein
MIGTPAYMAPEQVDGRNDEIGPATDVYGLGATLYEMLTGQSPFGADSTWETLRRIRNSEFPPPRKLCSLVPQDLEAICLKCLEFKPAHRYSSAHELADDLERFLQHEPVRARRPGPCERAVKWSSRRPLVASLLLLLAVCIPGGLSLVAWQWKQTTMHRDLAVSNFQIAHRSMRQLHELAMSDKRFSDPVFDDIRGILMASAHRYLRQLREENRGNVQIDWDIAEMGYRLAHASLSADNYDAAIDYCRLCIPEWEALTISSDKRVDAGYYLAKTHRILGTALARQGANVNATMPHMHKSEVILKRLIASNPNNYNLKNALAETYVTAGSLSKQLGKLEQALRYCDQAVELRREASRCAPSNRLIQRQLAEAHYRRAARLFRMADCQGAADECVRALKLLQPLHEKDYSQPTTGIYVARCLRLHGDAAAKAGNAYLTGQMRAAEMAALTQLADEFPLHRQVIHLLDDARNREMDERRVVN